MYRVPAFIFSVCVLVGLVLSGGFMATNAQKGSFNGMKKDAGDVAASSEQALHDKAAQELAEIDARAAGLPLRLAVPELMPLLTERDIAVAVAQAGQDAQQAALRVGQSKAQAMEAKLQAETTTRARLVSQMRAEKTLAHAVRS